MGRIWAPQALVCQKPALFLPAEGGGGGLLVVVVVGAIQMQLNFNSASSPCRSGAPLPFPTRTPPPTG